VAAFLIVSGSVVVENELENGETIRVAELGQGAIVGELSIIDGAERVSTIRAQGEVEVLVLAQWNLLAVIKSRPTIAAAMLPIIVKRFRETAQELRRRDRDSEGARKSLYQ
jgi:CRP-like cAMP-binding protein